MLISRILLEKFVYSKRELHIPDYALETLDSGLECKNLGRKKTHKRSHIKHSVQTYENRLYVDNINSLRPVIPDDMS
jgi:hypothetical protein